MFVVSVWKDEEGTAFIQVKNKNCIIVALNIFDVELVSHILLYVKINHIAQLLSSTLIRYRSQSGFRKRFNFVERSNTQVVLSMLRWGATGAYIHSYGKTLDGGP